MRIGRIGLLAGSLACLVTGGLAAQSALSMSRAVYIERASVGSSGGGTMRAIEPAETLRKGDRVVLLVEWETDSPGLEQTPRGYSVSSAVPRHLAFQSSSRDSYRVSINGGRTWGRLGRMRTIDDGGSRLVSPEDVTHIRWDIPETHLAVGRGRIAYSAIVR